VLVPLHLVSILITLLDAPRATLETVEARTGRSTRPCGTRLTLDGTIQLRHLPVRRLRCRLTASLGSSSPDWTPLGAPVQRACTGLHSRWSGTGRAQARFSAPSKAELNQYNNAQTGRFHVEKDYITRVGGRHNSLIPKSTIARVRHLAQEDFLKFLHLFRRLDTTGCGCIYRDEFVIILEKMATGLPQRQIEHLSDSLVDNEGRIDYQAFLEEYGSTTEYKMIMRGRRKGSGRAGAAGAKRTYLLTPPDARARHAETSSAMELSLLTCLLGFLCFPFWCCGFWWCNDTDKRKRRHGQASVALLCCFLVVACCVGMGLALKFSTDAVPVAQTGHCTPMNLVRLLLLFLSTNSHSQSLSS